MDISFVRSEEHCTAPPGTVLPSSCLPFVRPSLPRAPPPRKGEKEEEGRHKSLLAVINAVGGKWASVDGDLTSFLRRYRDGRRREVLRERKAVSKLSYRSFAQEVRGETANIFGGGMEEEEEAMGV